MKKTLELLDHWSHPSVLRERPFPPHSQVKKGSPEPFVVHCPALLPQPTGHSVPQHHAGGEAELPASAEEVLGEKGSV